MDYLLKVCWIRLLKFKLLSFLTSDRFWPGRFWQAKKSEDKSGPRSTDWTFNLSFAMWPMSWISRIHRTHGSPPVRRGLRGQRRKIGLGCTGKKSIPPQDHHEASLGSEPASVSSCSIWYSLAASLSVRRMPQRTHLAMEDRFAAHFFRRGETSFSGR